MSSDCFSGAAWLGSFDFGKARPELESLVEVVERDVSSGQCFDNLRDFCARGYGLPMFLLSHIEDVLAYVLLERPFVLKPKGKRLESLVWLLELATQRGSSRAYFLLKEYVTEQFQVFVRPAHAIL